MKKKLILFLITVTLLLSSFSWSQILAKNEERNLLVYSFDQKVYGYDPILDTTEFIGDWYSIYDYEMVHDELSNMNGGKRYKKDKELFNIDETKYSESYIHTILQSPYDSSQRIVLEVEDLNGNYNLGLLVNEDFKWKQSNETLSSESLLVPIFWFDQNNVLLGSGSLEDLSYYGFYVFDLIDYSIEPFSKLPINEEIQNVLQISNDEYFIIGDDQNAKIWDSTEQKYIQELGFSAQYTWGWLESKNLDKFQNSLRLFNEGKNTSTEGSFFNLIKKAKATTSKAFMYWPVPSNHSVACAIGCYSGHVGTDIGTSTDNTSKVFAVADGKVVAIQNDQPYGDYRVISPSSGNYVKLEHKANNTTYYTVYLHMTSNLAVSVNQEVKAGQFLGYGSNSGLTCGTQPVKTGGCLYQIGTYYHLHFEVNGSCGNSSCWLNPYNEGLWYYGSNGEILDPPVNTLNCSGTNVVLQNVNVNNGDSVVCTPTSSLTILPNSNIFEGSNFNSYIKNQ